jgi:hypothetical protein
MGQNCFVPNFVPGTKITPLVLSHGQKLHLFFGGPPPVVGNNDAVAGQWLSIIAASTNHSAAAMASAGDNNKDNNKANKPSPQAGMDADGGGRQQPDGRLESVWQELVLFNANAHSGRMTSSNDVANEGGGGQVTHRAGSTDNNQPKSGSDSGRNDGHGSGSGGGGQRLG